MRLYANAVRALGRTRAFAWVAPHVLAPLDVRFAGRRRSLTSLSNDFPLCYLTTTGRRTGESRTVPLLHVVDPPRAVVIGSNWGRRRDPAWALNLAAEPLAILRVEGRSRPVCARRATTAERERYWDEALPLLARICELSAPRRPRDPGVRARARSAPRALKALGYNHPRCCPR